MRTKSRFFFVIIGLLTALFVNESVAGENPLIGSWKWDNSKTLQNFKVPSEGPEELKQSALKAKAFVDSVAKNLRSNMLLTYRENECDQIIFDNQGREISHETTPYKLLEVRKDVVIIDQLDRGGIVKLFRDGANSLYVEVTVGTYKYRDYFTRQ